MKNYDLVIICRDNESIVNEIKKDVEELLKSKSIKINDQTIWGSRQLTFPIKKENQGYYIIYHITGPGPDVKSLEDALLIKENIIRFRIFIDLPKKEVKKKKIRGVKKHE